MAISYRVVDARTEAADILVEGVSTPEAAVKEALGLSVFRSGSQKDLVARVYWQNIGQPMSMVRLYSSCDYRERSTEKGAS
ncbi:MAG: hypothetical protein WBA73_11600 [Devosia sp.]